MGNSYSSVCRVSRLYLSRLTTGSYDVRRGRSLIVRNREFIPFINGQRIQIFYGKIETRIKS
jgi:hypothetical protein